MYMYRYKIVCILIKLMLVLGITEEGRSHFRRFATFWCQSGINFFERLSTPTWRYMSELTVRSGMVYKTCQGKRASKGDCSGTTSSVGATANAGGRPTGKETEFADVRRIRERELAAKRQREKRANVRYLSRLKR